MICGSKLLEKNLLCSRTGSVVVPPNEEAHRTSLVREHIEEKVFDEKLLARCCGHTSNTSTNLLEDKELGTLTPKPQDAFETLHNS